MSASERKVDRVLKGRYDSVFIKACRLSSQQTVPEKSMKLMLYSDTVLKLWGITPVFEGDITPKLKEGDLGTLVISNHPGSSDVALMLGLAGKIGLPPQTLKLLVSEHSFNMYGQFFDPDSFFIASTKPREAIQSFDRVSEHLNTGGTLIMFPGGFIPEGQVLRFNSGLAYLLERAQTDLSIVSCYIDPTYQRRVDEHLHEKLDLAERIVSYGELAGFENQPTIDVRIDSRFCSADKWREALGSGSHRQLNSNELLKNYLSLHKIQQG
jgi:hypothetical protein